MLITSRFIDHLPVREFFKQFFKLAFAQLPGLEKGAEQPAPEPQPQSNIYQEMNGLPHYDKSLAPDQMKTLPPFPRAPEDHRIQDARRRIKRAYIIEIAQKVLEMRHYAISEDMKLEILETNRINNKIHQHDNKGCLKLLGFFGDPEHIFEEYLFEYNKEKREQDQKEREQREKEEDEAMSKRKQVIKSKKFSSGSSSASLNNRSESHLSLEESESSDSLKRYNTRPVPQKKLRDSKSQFSLKEKLDTVRKNAAPSRNIGTRQNSRGASRQRAAANKPTPKFKNEPIKVFDAYDKQLPASDTDEDFLSSSSSERSKRSKRTKFPPIKSSRVVPKKQKKLYSETKSRVSAMTIHKTSRKSKRRGRQTDDERFGESDGTMSLATLKKKRKVHVKSLKRMPKNDIEKRAFKDLERMKKKKKRKEYIKKYEDQEKRRKDEREKIFLKDEIERRKQILGVHSTNEYMDGFRQIIFDMGDPEVARYERMQAKVKKDIELFDFDEEEYRDRQGIILYAKKYSKLLKFLFNKYANSGHSLKDVSNFDSLSKKSATINVAELGKLLKEHGFDHKELTMHEISKIVSLVSTKMMKKSELHSLNYEGFTQFMLQLSHYIYTKEPLDLSHLPPVEHIKELIKRFRYAAKRRGESTLLYEDPDITFVTDKDVLRELNYQVIQNPNYPLPEGYYKVQEKEMKMYYELPEYYDIAESQKIAVELVDNLILDIFGFHILEPIAKFETLTKVKPSFKKLSKPLPSTVRNKKGKKLDEVNPLSMGDSPKKRGRSRKREVKPKLPTSLKILVAQAPFEERAYVNEVAEVLEEILQAHEDGYSHLPPRDESRIGNIQNRIKIEEERQRQEEKRKKEERDAKIKKHHSQLRKEMEKRRQEKLRRDEEANKLAMEKRKAELEKQKKREESRAKYLENQKKKIGLKKQQEQEELKAKTEAEEKKKRDNSEKLRKEKQKFLKDQKQKLKKEFDERIQQRKELKNMESEIEYQKEIKKKRIMDNMVNYLKDHKEDREIDQKQKEQIHHFWEESQYIFEHNELDLGKVFRHYSRQNANTIDTKLSNNVNTMDMHEFVKFGKKNKIVPQLCNNDTLLHIFRVLAKARMEEAGPDDELGLVLDMESFEKSLILIAIEGREILGGSLKPKMVEDEKYNSKYQLGKWNKNQLASRAGSRLRSRAQSRGDESQSPPQKTPGNVTLESKKLKELSKKRPQYETEIKDIKIGKHFDVSAISTETLESCITYIMATKL